MKKLILPLSLVLLGFAGFATTAASAPRIEAHVSGPHISFQRDTRLASDINQLNRQLRIVRGDLRVYRATKNQRARFYQVERATERVNFQYRRGIGSRPELRRRANSLRAELVQIRHQLRNRPRGWR